MSVIYHKIPNKTLCAVLPSDSCFKYSNSIKGAQQMLSTYRGRKERTVF